MRQLFNTDAGGCSKISNLRHLLWRKFREMASSFFGNTRKLLPCETKHSLLERVSHNAELGGDFHNRPPFFGVQPASFNDHLASQNGVGIILPARTVWSDRLRVRFTLGLTAFCVPVGIIIRCCSRKQVCRITARRIIASMADMFRWFNLAIRVVISRTVGRDVFPIQGSYSVSLCGECASPRPATIRAGRLINAIPESFRGIFGSWHKQKTPTHLEAKSAQMSGNKANGRKTLGSFVFNSHFEAVESFA